MARFSSRMPSTAVYFVSPRLIASIAACFTLSGVSKSGSPAPRPMTSKPSALSSRALLVMAIVGEGFTLSSARATSPIRISQRSFEGASGEEYARGKALHPKRCDARHARARAQRSGAGDPAPPASQSLFCTLGCGLAVQTGFGQLGQLHIGIVFLLEILIEQRGHFPKAELIGPGDHRPISRDLVMLDRLGVGDHAGIENVRIGGLFHQLVAFFENAFDRRAGLACDLVLEQAKDLLEALDLAFGLFEMVLEGLAKLVGLG